MKYLENLNENQLRAVKSDSKYIRVIAGAGSGKTRVLTTRIIDLIKEKEVSFYNILAITFTNKAAGEMKERVSSFFGDETFTPRISTFHSFCAYFLRMEASYASLRKDFNIIDEEDKKSLLKKLLKENNIDKNDLNDKTLIRYISDAKTYNVVGNDNVNFYANKPWQETAKFIAGKYQEALLSMNSLDFDDLLVNTYLALNKNEDLKKKWRKKYRHILVDEFQDTNDLQYEIIRHISSKDCNIFVVGDPDQTIYTWRGANQKIILNFKKDYKNVETIILNENYRSRKPILDISNKLIAFNKNRVKKDLKTSKSEGSEVMLNCLENSKHEAKNVVSIINQYTSDSTYKYSDIAILYRANYISGEFEKQLQMRRIPYKIFGGLRFFARKEIKDTIAYLKLLINKEDDISLLRIINTPRREIGQITIDRLVGEATKRKISIYNLLKEDTSLLSRKKAVEKINYMIEIIEKYSEMLQEGVSVSSFIEDYIESLSLELSFDEEKKQEKKENVNEFFNMIFDYEKESDEFSLNEFLQEVTLTSSQDEIDDKNYVSLMTVHTAKGLEYPLVFVVGLNDGVFPSKRSLLDGKEEEERRLAYVAFTRAKEQLILTNNRGINFISGNANNDSRFLVECGLIEKRKEKKELRNNKMTQLHEDESLKSNDIEWKKGDKIEHKIFGFGIVLNADGKFIEVAFKNNKEGRKKLLGSHKFISKV